MRPARLLAVLALSASASAQPRAPARALSVTPTPGEVVWLRGGDARVGSDSIAMDHAITLCRREIRRAAALLGEPEEADGFRLRMRLLLTVCLDQPVPEGCAASLFAREAGPRDVWLSPYGLDRTEVTVEAYARCVRAGACAEPMDPPWSPHTGGPTLPVTGVSWQDADTYCRWVGGRLPTDAEWEHAARGREARPFPWGRQWDPGRANHGAIAPSCRSDDDGFALAAPVGSFPAGATPEGVLDLAGNVQEWVEDRADPARPNHPAEPAVNPRGPSLGASRLARGGAYNHPPWALRTTWRVALGSGERRRDTGFRCAWDPLRLGIRPGSAHDGTALALPRLVSFGGVLDTAGPRPPDAHLCHPDPRQTREQGHGREARDLRGARGHERYRPARRLGLATARAGAA